MYLEQLQALLDGSIAPRRWRRIESLDILLTLMTRVRVARLDQLHCPRVQLLEIVTRMRYARRLVA